MRDEYFRNRMEQIGAFSKNNVILSVIEIIYPTPGSHYQGVRMDVYKLQDFAVLLQGNSQSSISLAIIGSKFIFIYIIYP